MMWCYGFRFKWKYVKRLAEEQGFYNGDVGDVHHTSGGMVVMRKDIVTALQQVSNLIKINIANCNQTKTYMCITRLKNVI